MMRLLLLGATFGAAALVFWRPWSVGPKAAPPRHASALQQGSLAAVAPLPSSPESAQEEIAPDALSIATELDPQRRSALMDRFVAGIRTEDMEKVLDELQSSDESPINRELVGRLVLGWAEQDPREAANWAEAEPDGAARQEDLERVAAAWANQGLDDAVLWFRDLSSGSERAGGLAAIAYEAARTNPVRALSIAIELPATPGRDDLIVHAAGQLAAATPEIAAEWAGEIKNPALRQRVFETVAETWAETDAVSAANLAVKSIEPGRGQDDAVVGIVKRWAQQSPDDAAAWVAQFPKGPLRDASLAGLTNL